MTRHELQEINAGSMADIAFLLLIFFLVTTTMDTDWGMVRKLPPDIQATQPPVVNGRNVLEILVNRNNQLLVEGNITPVNQLKEVALEFISNPYNKSNLPIVKERDYKFFKKVNVTPNHIISLQSDRGTSYSTYIAVQNELTAAYGDLKEKLAQERYKCTYNDLSQEIKTVLDDIYSAKISEAEPVASTLNE